MNEEPQAIAIKETIKALAKPVQDFISAVVGEPSKELGGWISDNIRGKRLDTQIRIFTKAQTLVKESGINPNAVNLKLLVPLLESGSLENDDDIIGMWSNLLASASLSNDIRISYISILKELEVVEAKIMQYVFQQLISNYGINFEPNNEYAGSIDGVLICKIFSFNNAEFERSVDNLFRLRLLAPTASRLEFIDNKEIPFAHYTKKQLGVTYLGYYFAKACNQAPETVIK